MSVADHVLFHTILRYLLFYTFFRLCCEDKTLSDVAAFPAGSGFAEPSIVLNTYEKNGQTHTWTVTVHPGVAPPYLFRNVQLVLLTNTGEVVKKADVETFLEVMSFSHDGQINRNCKFQ